MSVYYNEFDPKAAAWLRELINQGHLPAGAVDTRSIVDVKAEDLKGYTQCHFFAGIGGWPLALAMAGWSAERPVWTGSCPCQPFSQANSWKKENDERDLFHVWANLVRECEPAIIFGEQVASPAGLAWFDTVRTDLENEGYAVGGADLCAAGVGAPHIRQRLYWVALASRERRERERLRLQPRGSQQTGAEAGRSGEAGSVGDPDGARSQGRGECRYSADQLSPWTSGVAYVACSDGKIRPVESGAFPLVARIPKGLGRVRDPRGSIDDIGNTAEARIMRLRGYGNALCVPLAAQFVGAVCEILTSESASATRIA